MTSHFIQIAEWLFQFGLLFILGMTIIFARRLEAILRQVRSDHASLQLALQQLDTSLLTATAATDHLMLESSRADQVLKEACASAEAATWKLDDLIGRATRTLSLPPATPVISEPEPAVCAPASRRSTKLQSRGERDLARVLLDAR